MGKKGVLLDNGKAARSSMSLYWNNAQNKDKKDKPAKAQAPQENIQERAGSNLQKWKEHKQKLINKLYQKPQKKQKINVEAQKQRLRQQQQQVERDQLERQLNKHKPITIPGFKNAAKLKEKMQYEQAIAGKQETNKLIPRGPGEELSHEDIVHILRQKKAKKELQRMQKQRIDNNLRQRQKHSDIMMMGFPIEQTPKQKQQQQPLKEPQIKPPQPYFKSQILQKIQKGQSLHSKQQKIVLEQKNTIPTSIQPVIVFEQKPQAFVPKFIPRALWQK